MRNYIKIILLVLITTILFTSCGKKYFFDFHYFKSDVLLDDNKTITIAKDTKNSKIAEIKKK